MRDIAKSLTDDEITALGNYILKGRFF